MIFGFLDLDLNLMFSSFIDFPANSWFHFSLQSNSVSWCIYTKFSLLIHKLKDPFIGCFYFLAIAVWFHLLHCEQDNSEHGCTSDSMLSWLRVLQAYSQEWKPLYRFHHAACWLHFVFENVVLLSLPFPLFPFLSSPISLLIVLCIASLQKLLSWESSLSCILLLINLI